MSQIVEPPIRDDSGYAIKRSDLTFLGITEDNVVRWRSKESPLGMDRRTYKEFVRSLFHALTREGVSDADVRLQGSSTHFFSGKHKSMPFGRSRLVDEYFSTRKTSPTMIEVEDMEDSLHAQWPDDDRPLRRPFDALHRINLHPEPSDYDVQISSRQLVALVEDEISALQARPAEIRLENPTYNFVRKEFVERSLLYLSTWQNRADKLVGRPVTIALFDADGPPHVEHSGGVAMSSHFRDSDWRIHPSDAGASS